MKILFAPLGLQDTLTESRDPDTGALTSGAESPLLARCRKEMPDRIVLYLPKETAALQAQDRRYVQALALLGMELGTAFDVRAESRPEIGGDAPSQALTDDLAATLDAIRSDFPDAELIIHTDSAPAFFADAVQAALTADRTAAPAADAAPLPDNAEPIPADTDITAPAEIPASEPAADADAPAEIPAAEPQADPAEKAAADAADAAIRNVLKTLIAQFEYRSALAVAKQSGSLPDAFIRLLEAAALRGTVGVGAMQQAFRQCGAEALLGGGNQFTEYYLQLALYVRKKMYGEFVHAVSPILPEIIISAIRKQFGLDINKNCIYGSRKWDHNKLMLEQMTGKFKESYVYHTKPRPGNLGVYVTTANLSALIENISVPKKDGRIMLDTLKLRSEIEEKLRGFAYYSVQPFTPADLQKVNARSPEEMIVQIRDYIRNYTDIPLSDEALRSYDAINEKLIALMG